MIWDGEEKRKETRQIVRANLPCRIIVDTPQKEIIDTVSNNIGEGGVGFTLMGELQISSIVGLEIYKIKRKPIVCKGIVKWVNAIRSSFTSYHRGEFLFNTGIQFYKIRNKDKSVIRNFIASIISDKNAPQKKSTSC